MRYLLDAAGSPLPPARFGLVLLLSIAAFFVVAAVALTVRSARPVAAQEAVTVELDAPAFVLPDTESPVVVQIDDVENLAGADVRLVYDPAHLTVVQVVLENTFDQCESDSNSAVPGVLDLVLLCSTGHGHKLLDLWTVTFRSADASSDTRTVIDVTQTDLADGFLPTQSIPSVGVDTTVTIVSVPIPVHIVTPGTVAPGEEFQVAVQVNEALTSKGAQFGLEYDVNRFTFNGAQAGVAFAECLADVFEPSVGTVNTALACNDGRTGAPLVLWTFTFDVPIDASSGTSVFSLENLVLSDDRNPHAIPSTVVDAQVRVARTTDLSVTKTDSPDPVVAGTPMTYTLTAANVGPEDAFGVVVTDEFPAEVTFDSATQGCLYDVPSHSVT